MRACRQFVFAFFRKKIQWGARKANYGSAKCCSVLNFGDKGEKDQKYPIKWKLIHYFFFYKQKG